MIPLIIIYLYLQFRSPAHDRQTSMFAATRCSFLANGLSEVTYILEPYKVDPISCVLSEVLKKPHITLGHEHNRQCRSVISMRPEPAQLNQALIAMIKEHQPREVAVIIEGKTKVSIDFY